MILPYMILPFGGSAVVRGAVESNSSRTRFLQHSVAADVSRRKHLELARTNVRGYEVLKEP